MKDITKYQGVFPAFYACYDAEGNISVEGVKALTRHLIAKGVKGVYVGGSSGECIYQSVAERKTVLEAVMSEANGQDHRHCSCWLQQHRRQRGAGPPCRERGRGRHRFHPAHLLPPAGVRHCQVLERHVRGCSQHRVRHLQHAPSWLAQP